MNPEIQKELLLWLQTLRQAVDTGAAFAKQQIPQVLWEKVLLDRAFYSVVLVMSVLLILAPLAYYKRMWAWAKLRDSASEGGSYAVAFLAIVAPAIAGFMWTLNILYPFLNVWFAPRLYLINWIKEFITK